VSFDVQVLTRSVAPKVAPPFLITVAETAGERAAARQLRRDTFVTEQQVFTGDDHDDADDHPRTLTLNARAVTGEVVGTVRLALSGTDDLGWWVGSRLAVRRSARGHELGIGSALVRAACAHAEALGRCASMPGFSPRTALCSPGSAGPTSARRPATGGRTG